ncbi:flagellar filament capping protein FliD [Desulfobotulus mexicanus]|uniref:Flagellar hook-associated protein 2 n=1 Tax=Desulfobotulus mexicanus TaxID=2586642 RepID=A0A5Q4VH97_9BACT|nr:flagellar filament capping protein FliD [Desulfobotulus mexicanus]TYT76288.1 flagellar filament capping protein FliD [Desulfobotulus mexicanus]
MTLGTISTVGLGSGLGLQQMLDDLREIDEAPIKRQKENRTLMQAQARTLDTLNADLMGVRSSARTLSLESHFLGRKVSSGKDDVATATASSGIATGSHSLEVHSMAKKSTWQSSGGFSDPSAAFYEHPKTGLLSGDSVALEDATTIHLTFGSREEKISVDIPAGATLNEVAEAINNAPGNLDENGKPLMRASLATAPSGDSYLYIQPADPDETVHQNIIIEGTEEGPDLSFLKSDITFSFKVGAENDPIYVRIPPGSSYQGMVSAINEQAEKHGMDASIINDGSSKDPYRFTLTARETGEASRIFLSPNFAGIMDEVQGGEEESLNARFTVNGITYQRNSDRGLEDIIPGLSLNLESEGKTTISITADHDGVKESIMEMMEGIIKFSEDIARHTKREPEEEDEGLLKDLSSVRNIERELKTLISQRVGQGSVSSLYDLGLSFDGAGRISFDENKLDKMLESDPEAVRNFFLDNKETEQKGFASIMNERLSQLTSDTGPLSLQKNTLEERERRLETTIENATVRLDKKYEIMTHEFIRLDKAINSLNSQADFMKSMFDSFNNAANNNKK